jgi:Flp pilus assembly protein TadD
MWLALGAAALAYDGRATAAAPKRAALFAAVLLLAVLARRASRRVPAAAGLWLAWVAWMAASLAWGTVAGAADALSWLASAGVVLVAVELPADELRARVGEIAALVGGGASLWALVEWLSGARGVAVHGGQGNADWLGLTLAATLPCAIEWARGGRQARWAVVGAFAVGFLCARSRTSMVAALFGVGIVFELWRGRRIWIAVAGALPSLWLLIAGWHALEGRVWIWHWSARAALGALPFGTGLGGFGLAYAEAQSEALRALPLPDAERLFVHTPSAHQDWLQALVEGGLPSLALLVAAFVLGLRAHRAWRAGAGTLVVVAVAAFADTPLRQPAVLLMIALVLAACPSLPAASNFRRLAAIALASLGLACATAAWLAERLATAARDADPPTRTALLARAARLDPLSPTIAFEQGLAALEAHDPRTAITHLERAHWQVATDVALGNAYLSLDEPAHAEAWYRHALRLAPGSFRARLNLAESLRLQGRLTDAAAELSRARTLRPHAASVRDLTTLLDDP